MFFRYSIDFKYNGGTFKVDFNCGDVMAASSVDSVANEMIRELKVMLYCNHLEFDEILEELNDKNDRFNIDYSMNIIDLSSYNRSEGEIKKDFMDKLNNNMPEWSVSYENGWKYLVAGYRYIVYLDRDGSPYLERFADLYYPDKGKLESGPYRCELEDSEDSTFEKFKQGDIVRYTGAHEFGDKDDLYIMEFDWYRNPIGRHNVFWPVTMDIMSLKTGEIIIETHPKDMEPVRPSTDEERESANKYWGFL